MLPRSEPSPEDRTAPLPSAYALSAENNRHSAPKNLSQQFRGSPRSLRASLCIRYVNILRVLCALPSASSALSFFSFFPFFLSFFFLFSFFLSFFSRSSPDLCLTTRPPILY